MSSIAINPIQWTSIANIDAADTTFTEEDAACLAEVRQVLVKHGRLAKFGVTLIHKHFELRDHEYLLETIDEENRTLTMNVVDQSLLSGCIPTQWSLERETAAQWCRSYCKKGEVGKHFFAHLKAS